MFTLKFSCANAAFDGSNWQEEQTVATILRDVAERIAAGTRQGHVRDPNGNTIGNFKLVG